MSWVDAVRKWAEGQKRLAEAYQQLSSASLAQLNQLAQQLDKAGEQAKQVLMDLRDFSLARIAEAEKLPRFSPQAFLLEGLGGLGAAGSTAVLTLFSTLYPSEVARNLQALQSVVQRKGVQGVAELAAVQLGDLLRQAGESPRTAIPQIAGGLAAGMLLGKLAGKLGGAVGGRIGDVIADFLPDVLQGDPLGLVIDTVKIPLHGVGKVVELKVVREPGQGGKPVTRLERVGFSSFGELMEKDHAAVRAYLFNRALEELSKRLSGRVDDAELRSVAYAAVDAVLRGAEPSALRVALPAGKGLVEAAAEQVLDRARLASVALKSADAIGKSLEGSFAEVARMAGLFERHWVPVELYERLPLLRELAVSRAEEFAQLLKRAGVDPEKMSPADAVKLKNIVSTLSNIAVRAAEESGRGGAKVFSTASEAAEQLRLLAHAVGNLSDELRALGPGFEDAARAAEELRGKLLAYSAAVGSIPEELLRALEESLAGKPGAVEAAVKLLSGGKLGEIEAHVSGDVVAFAKSVAERLSSFAEGARRAVEEAEKSGLKVEGAMDVVRKLGELKARVDELVKSDRLLDHAEWARVEESFRGSLKALGEWVTARGSDPHMLAALRLMAKETGSKLLDELYRSYAEKLASAWKGDAYIVTRFVEAAVNAGDLRLASAIDEFVKSLSEARASKNPGAVLPALKALAERLGQAGFKQPAEALAGFAESVEELSKHGKLLDADAFLAGISAIMRGLAEQVEGKPLPADADKALKSFYAAAALLREAGPARLAAHLQEAEGAFTRLAAAKWVEGLLERAEEGLSRADEALLQKVAKAVGAETPVEAVARLRDLLRKGGDSQLWEKLLREAAESSPESRAALRALEELRAARRKLEAGSLQAEDLDALRRLSKELASLVPEDVKRTVEKYGPVASYLSADLAEYVRVLNELPAGKVGGLQATVGELESRLASRLEKLEAVSNALAVLREERSGRGVYKGAEYSFTSKPLSEGEGGVFAHEVVLRDTAGRVVVVKRYIEVPDSSLVGDLRRLLAGKMPESLRWLAERVYQPVKVKYATLIFYDPEVKPELVELARRVADGDPEALGKVGLNVRELVLPLPAPAFAKHAAAALLSAPAAGAVLLPSQVTFTVRNPVTGEDMHLDEVRVRELAASIEAEALRAPPERLQQLEKILDALIPAAHALGVDVTPAVRAVEARLREIAKTQVPAQVESVKPQVEQPAEERSKEERAEEGVRAEGEVQREQPKAASAAQPMEEQQGGGEAQPRPGYRFTVGVDDLARAVGVEPYGWSAFGVNSRAAAELKDKLLPEHSWAGRIAEILSRIGVAYFFTLNPRSDEKEGSEPLFIFVPPSMWEAVEPYVKERRIPLPPPIGEVAVPVLDLAELGFTPFVGVIASDVSVEGVVVDTAVPELQLMIEQQSGEAAEVPRVKLTAELPTPPVQPPAYTPLLNEVAGAGSGVAARRPARQREVLVV